MAQAILMSERDLHGPIPTDTTRVACEHDAVWIVDVASRRVIRAACVSCETALRAVVVVPAPVERSLELRDMTLGTRR
ncbi:MAG: hypothetical protein HYX53_08535 [Chloroflexi bacterium]|nr:hypothetical protein [Chloroflexota bacterium]